MIFDKTKCTSLLWLNIICNRYIELFFPNNFDFIDPTNPIWSYLKKKSNNFDSHEKYPSINFDTMKNNLLS